MEQFRDLALEFEEMIERVSSFPERWPEEAACEFAIAGWNYLATQSFIDAVECDYCGTSLAVLDKTTDAVALHNQS